MSGWRGSHVSFSPEIVENTWWATAWYLERKQCVTAVYMDRRANSETSIVSDSNKRKSKIKSHLWMRFPSFGRMINWLAVNWRSLGCFLFLAIKSLLQNPCLPLLCLAPCLRPCHSDHALVIKCALLRKNSKQYRGYNVGHFSPSHSPSLPVNITSTAHGRKVEILKKPNQGGLSVCLLVSSILPWVLVTREDHA